MGEFYGFEKKEFEFEGKNAIVVFADKSNRTDKWMLKTEYFDAFPNVQVELLKMGYNIAHVNNETRWCKDSDTKRQHDFAVYLHNQYGFNKKYGVIGMSCGGMQGIFLAAKYPDDISVLYLDAPVINFLSCPAGLGNASKTAIDYKEFELERKMTISQLLSFRHNPLDYFEQLIKKDIPVILVCGDSDKTVPYEENGELLYKCYTENHRTISLVLKPGIDHHPHSLENNTPIVEFIRKYY